jgi:hypothetical protein
MVLQPSKIAKRPRVQNWPKNELVTGPVQVSQNHWVSSTHGSLYKGQLINMQEQNQSLGANSSTHFHFSLFSTKDQTLTVFQKHDEVHEELHPQIINPNSIQPQSFTKPYQFHHQKVQFNSYVQNQFKIR